MSTRAEMAESMRLSDAEALERAARVVGRLMITTEGGNTGAIVRALKEAATASRAEAAAIRAQA